MVASWKPYPVLSLLCGKFERLTFLVTGFKPRTLGVGLVVGCIVVKRNFNS